MTVLKTEIVCYGLKVIILYRHGSVPISESTRIENGLCGSNEEHRQRLIDVYKNIITNSEEFVSHIEKANGRNFEHITDQLNDSSSSLKIQEVPEDDIKYITDDVPEESVTSPLKSRESYVGSKFEMSREESAEFVLKLRQEIEAEVTDQLEAKYKQEMSNLREYFQNFCQKQYHEKYSDETDFRGTSLSVSNEFQDSLNIDQDNDRARPRSADPDIAGRSPGRKRVKEKPTESKEYFGKDIQSIARIYRTKWNKTKEELCAQKELEIENVKRNLSSEIETLKQQLNSTLTEKALDQTVKRVFESVKEGYEKEMQGMRSKLQEEYCQKLEEEIENIKTRLNDIHFEEISKLKEEHETAAKRKTAQIERLEQEKAQYNFKLKSLNEQWKNKTDEVLSSLIVNTSLKKVVSELNSEIELEKKNELLSKITSELEENMKQYQQHLEKLTSSNSEELEDLKNSYETQIKALTEDYNTDIKRLKERNSKQERELLTLKLKHEKEICDLKNEHKNNLVDLQSDQEYDIVRKLSEEMHNLKDSYNSKISLMQNQISSLTIQHVTENEAERRSQLLSSVLTEIEELLNKEMNGEQPTWPAELAALEKVLSRARRSSAAEFHDKSTETDVLKVQHDTRMDQSIQTDLCNIDQILKERDILKQTNNTLQCAVTEFTKYLLNCEEELNNTLIGELIYSNECSNMKDLNVESENASNLKRVHFAPDMTEILNSLSHREDTENASEDKFQNSLIIQSELNTCLQRLRQEAAMILSLTSGRGFKHDRNNVYTQVNFFEELETELANSKSYVRLLQEDIMGLRQTCEEQERQVLLQKQQIADLTDKNYTLGSFENDADNLNTSIDFCHRFHNLASLQSKVALILENEDLSSPKLLQLVEELCHECERLKEEAKRDKDDLRSQVEAADKQLRNIKQFLENQAVERETERDEFERKVKTLECELKEKERCLSIKNKFETEIRNQELQISELSEELEKTRENASMLETNFTFASNKIQSLRDHIHEIESQLAEKSEEAEKLRLELIEKEKELEEQNKQYQSLVRELESMKEGDVEQLQTLQEQHQVSFYLLRRIKKQLTETENTITKRTKELEKVCVILSASTQLPSEEASVSERTDDISSPTNSDTFSPPVNTPTDLLSCLRNKLKALYTAEEVLLRRVKDQENQLAEMALSLEDALLDREAAQDNLNANTQKIAMLEVERDNMRHRLLTRDTVTSYTAKIKDLETEIDHLKFSLAQKELEAENVKQRGADTKDENKDIEEKRTSLVNEITYLEQPEYSRDSVNANMTLEPPHFSMLPDTSEPSSKVDGAKISDSDLFSAAVTENILKEMEQKETKLRDLEQLLNTKKAEISSLVTELENEKQNHLESLLRLRTLSSELETERKRIAEIEAARTADLRSTAEKLSALEMEKNSLEKSVIFLKKDLEITQESVEGFKRQIVEKHNAYENLKVENEQTKEEHFNAIKELYELRTRLTMEKENIRELQENRAALIKEKEIEQKNNSNELFKLSYELQMEKEKNKNLGKTVAECESELMKLRFEEKKLYEEKQKMMGLETMIKNLEMEKANVEKALSEAQNKCDSEKLKVKGLEEINAKLEYEVEGIKQLEKEVATLKERLKDSEDVDSSNLVQACSTGSLHDLTKKVQKQVDLAAELDQSMLVNLNMDESFLPLAIASDNIKQVLAKVIHYGTEVLTDEEKATFHSMICCQGYVESLSESENAKELKLKLETESKKNAKLTEQLAEHGSRVKQLQMIIDHLEERNLFLMSKMEEWQKKATEAEIKLAKESSKLVQMELGYESKINKVKEKQEEDIKEIQALNKHISEITNDNMLLEKEIRELRFKIHMLTTELNLMKTIQPDAGYDFQKCISPLKAELEKVARQYRQAKSDLIKEKSQAATTINRLDDVIKKNDKLKDTLDSVLSENSLLQAKIYDLEREVEGQKQFRNKLEEKLSVVELYDKRKRKLTSEQIMKKELQMDDLKKEYLALRKRSANIEAELNALRNKCFCSSYEPQVKRILCRMLYAESYRRSLVFQKCCLLSYPAMKDPKGKLMPKQLFRSACITIISIQRMKYFVVKRRRHVAKVMDSHLSRNILISQKLPPVTTRNSPVQLNRESEEQLGNVNLNGTLNTSQNSLPSSDENILKEYTEPKSATQSGDTVVNLHAHFLELQRKYIQESE